MSFFGKLFGSKSSSSASAKGDGDLESQLAELEAQAERAPLGFQGRPLNRAGDVCLQAGDHDRALRYYGLAIDSLLEDIQPEAARGVANKIIRVHPSAVRTLCTLTWLDLASRHIATAVQDVKLYAESAKNGGRQDMAVPEVLSMAGVVGSEDFLNAAADALVLLEATDEADKVRRWAEKGGSGEHIQDAEKLSAACLKAAVGSNEGRNAEGAVA
jgi:tetratricopeptide (TPR) repeat protein